LAKKLTQASVKEQAEEEKSYYGQDIMVTNPTDF